jgi:class 3 adenylate cyclase/tetratricopeptide (TPR) repeat protein
MRCPRCGAGNDDSARFCEDCGSPLALICQNCGTPATPGKRFCRQCGAPVSDSRSDEAPSRVVGAAGNAQVDNTAVAERRLVSVLFADLVGFTSLSETRDAEEVRDLLSRFNEICRVAVERYGGIVENFIGDAVLAVWGSPTAHEDDAERAVRCGLELVEAISVLGIEVNAPGLSARAGVLTGEAAVNFGTTSERMIAGDLVNTASRLQSAAEPRTVYVGEATYQAANHAIAFSEVGELTLKGKDEPVRAWRALRVVAQRKGVGRTEGIEAPFVGRDEELRALKEGLDALSRERRARLISVTGIPGIGKSRLAWEFKKYVDGLVETIYWHHGRSPAYGEGISFWALSEMVRMRAAITEEEDAVSARQKLAATLAEFVPDADERTWIEPRLSHLLGLGDAPPGHRDETFSAWRSFFEHVARDAPVVMVFEDLQWADPGLIDFIESILEWSRSQPILVLCLARPELLERRPNWGAGQRAFMSIHLDPLSRDAMHQLLSGLVRDLPEQLSNRILERAEGVPLYAVEIVRMLSGKGLLVERDGAYDASEELSDFEVPDSLHSLIASRLDSLPNEERALLQDAAVLGKSFSTAALSVLTGTSPDDLDIPLRDLVRKELLLVDNDPRSPERGQYGFLQGLIREVAHSTLGRKDRRAKHLAAAHYFESLGDDELSGVVAAHYLEAFEASPDGPEREALGARARDTLAEAGRRAMSLGSPEQALSYFEQSLEIAVPGTERAELWELAGEAASRAGELERARSHLELAIAFHENAGDAAAAGMAVALWARIVGLGSTRFSEAIERAERAYVNLGELGDARVRANLAAVLADLCARSGEPARGHEWAETALLLVEQMDEPELLARALWAEAAALFNLGRHQQAVILARGILPIAESAGSLVEQSRGLLALSVYLLDDDPREAHTATVRTVEVSRRAGDRGREILSLLNQAELAIFLGELNETETILAELDERDLPVDSSRWRTACHGLLRALRGDVTGAIATFDELAEGVIASEYVHDRATYYAGRALVSLVAGDLESAYEEAAEAVAADPSGINSPKSLEIQARAALWLHDPDRARAALSGMRGFRGRWMANVRVSTEAGLAAIEGRFDEALATYERARRTWNELGTPLDLALCEMDVALLVAPHQAASVAAERARQLIRDIGSPPLLAQLEAHGRQMANAAGSGDETP